MAKPISAYNTVQAAKRLEQDAQLEIDNVQGLIGTGLRGSDKTISDARKRAAYMNENAKRYRSLANAAVKKGTGRDYPLASSPSFGD
jgi:phage-related tail protein